MNITKGLKFVLDRHGIKEQDLQHVYCGCRYLVFYMKYGENTDVVCNYNLEDIASSEEIQSAAAMRFSEISVYDLYEDRERDLQLGLK